MENRPQNLRQLLAQLSSDEVRLKVVKSLTIEKPDYKKDVIGEADFPVVSEFYEKTGNFLFAAEYAEKAGQTERAEKLYAKASEEEEKEGIIWSAAEYAEKAGQTERAEKLHARASEEEEKLAEESLRNEKSFSDHDHTSYHHHISAAAEYAEKAGQTERAKKLYAKASETSLALSPFPALSSSYKAAEYAEKAGQTERAIKLYEKYGEFSDAARCAREAGLTERANALEQLIAYLK